MLKRLDSGYDCIEWTAKEWADKLNCMASSVVKTEAWQKTQDHRYLCSRRACAAG
jgi:hypothetical protein